MSLKYAYNSNEENIILFHKFELYQATDFV